MTLVELREVEQFFGGRPVLRNLDLCVPSGQYVVLLGESGCGKTTTLRIIAGLQKPDRGSVFLDHQCVDRVAPRDRNVAMIFQQDALYPHLTVRQSLRFSLTGKLPNSQIDARLDRAIELTKIGSILDRYPDRLSGGELRRAAIAKAITRGASLRLLDEPLSALDIPVRYTLQQDILRWHSSQPGTTIHVTHDGQEAMQMADSIAVMEAGKIVQFASPEEIYRKPDTVSVAKSIGSPPINLFPATIEAGKIESHQREIRMSVNVINRNHDHQAQDVVVGIRPDALKIADEAPSDRKPGLEIIAENLTSRLIDRRVEVSANLGSVSITAVVPRETFTSTGPLRLLASLSDLHCFDVKTGQRIELVEGGAWNS